MLILIYLLFLCSNFLFIKSEDNRNTIVTIDVKPGVNCTTDFGEYTLTDGFNVTLLVRPKMHINRGWWRLYSATGHKFIYDKLKTVENLNEITYTHLVNKSMEGKWEFEFYYYINNNQYKNKMATAQDGNNNYTTSVCRTKIRVVPPEPPADQIPLEPKADQNKKCIIVASTVGVIAFIVIVVQSAYIIYLKAKARKLVTLNTHNNLSKKMDPAPNDTARYCSNPGQKMAKVADPVNGNNRESVIYEAPNIEISGSRVPMPPPQLPAIATMPRSTIVNTGPPRTDNNMKADHQSMLASALNSPARGPSIENHPHTLSRSNHMEREINVANRPPLPLPPQGFPQNNMFQEVYEDMDAIEENTYEPPPVINTMPPRLPMPPKKVPTGNLLNVRENNLKSRAMNKLPVTKKPQRSGSNSISSNELEQALRRRNNDAMPKSNAGHTMQSEQATRRIPNADAQKIELEEALKRRKNVMPVPITSIPDPSSKASQRSRPPVATKSRGPPVHPIQEEIYYNENQASSDEEWTYEPLKPLHSYDANIYNI